MLHNNPNDVDYNIPTGELLFTVSDEGDGIPPDDLPHIFERNFSSGRKIKPDMQKKPMLYNDNFMASRSGLGLHISKQIITQHSGRMFAKNNQWGGAEISFTLPYYK